MFNLFAAFLMYAIQSVQILFLSHINIRFNCLFTMKLLWVNRFRNLGFYLFIYFVGGSFIFTSQCRPVCHIACFIEYSTICCRDITRNWLKKGGLYFTRDWTAFYSCQSFKQRNFPNQTVFILDLMPWSVPTLSNPALVLKSVQCCSIKLVNF